MKSVNINLKLFVLSFVMIASTINDYSCVNALKLSSEPNFDVGDLLSKYNIKINIRDEIDNKEEAKKQSHQQEKPEHIPELAGGQDLKIKPIEQQTTV